MHIKEAAKTALSQIAEGNDDAVVTHADWHNRILQPVLKDGELTTWLEVNVFRPSASDPDFVQGKPRFKIIGEFDISDESNAAKDSSSGSQEWKVVNLSDFDLKRLSEQKPSSNMLLQDNPGLIDLSKELSRNTRENLETIRLIKTMRDDERPMKTLEERKAMRETFKQFNGGSVAKSESPQPAVKKIISKATTTVPTAEELAKLPDGLREAMERNIKKLAKQEQK
jgi:hypothetical protein